MPAQAFNPVVLVEGEPGRLNELARRIRLRGADPIIATGTAEAASVLPAPGADVGTTVVLIDAGLTGRSLKKDLQRLRSAAGDLELFFLAVL